MVQALCVGDKLFVVLFSQFCVLPNGYDANESITCQRNFRKNLEDKNFAIVTQLSWKLDELGCVQLQISIVVLIGIWDLL